MIDPQIAVGDLVKYCDWLARNNSEALSFIPTPKLELYARAGRILTVTENGDLCGFLVFGNGYPYLRVYQACIQYDARLRKHGLGLVERLKYEARKRGVFDIKLRCAQDLEANKFWNEVGFQLYGSRMGGVRRGRILNLWKMNINRDPQMELFDK